MAFIRRRRKILIPGPVLVGFSELFDQASGIPTELPLAKIKPASVGGMLLPFECVHCGEVKPDVVHPKKWRNYHDETRGHSWCPACQGRYVIDPKGAPLVEPVAVGSSHAPALVERGGTVAILGGQPSGLATLGATL